MLAQDGTFDEHEEVFKFSEAVKAWRAPHLWIISPIVFFNGKWRGAKRCASV